MGCGVCVETVDKIFILTSFSIDMGEAVKLVLALLGKCAVTGSFSIIYLYSAELFPTQVR